MRTLYFECKMGAAGDMLMAALSELVDQNAFAAKINALGIEGVQVSLKESVKCGIHGTHVEVLVHGEEELSLDVAHQHMHEEAEHSHEHGHEHHHHEHEHHEHSHDHSHEHHHAHTHIHDIYHLIDHMDVSDRVKKDAKAIYGLIAEAESHAHGVEIDQVHFHEVGSLDAVVDVVGNCILMEMVGADRVYASPVAFGNGMVRCAHGIMPVPTPATAYLLKGIPSYAGRMDGELLTPTGAAILKYFVQDFCSMPTMSFEKIGYGMGNKDFPAANCVRAFLGESEDDGEIVELICNLDDMSSEDIGFAIDELFAHGALDVYYTPVGMKKNRPGIVFTCMCRMDDRDTMLQLMFQNLTTLGIRQYTSQRFALKRKIETVDTVYGPVRKKVSVGYGTVREKLEFEDLAKIARDHQISIHEVRSKIKEK